LGAPQARQVVDRFHLVRNLAEVLAARSLRIVARKFARKTLISFCHKRQQRTLLVRFLLQLRGNNALHLISKSLIKHAKPAAMIVFVR
jgi:transposase